MPPVFLRGRFVLLAVVILLVAMTGSATAGSLITGKRIKNGSVTGVDLRNGSVTGLDLRDGSVTGIDIRDGSLAVRDLVAEQRFTYVGEPGGPVLRNGGEGDCVWTDLSSTGADLAPAGYRIDRFGTVHLSGVVTSVAVAGAGDGTCASGDQDEITEDRIALILPRRYWPAQSVLIGLGEGILIAGPQGFENEGLSLPPGAVYCETFCALQGASYLPVGSTLARAARPATGSSPAVGRVLEQFGLR